MSENLSPKKVIREPNALYALLTDVSALEEEPIFVNIGKTRAVLLSEARYLELTGRRMTDRQTAEMLEPLKPEIEAFEQLLPELLKEHEGKWVAIHGGQIVAMSQNKQEILDLIVVQRYEPVFFHRVQAGPRIGEITRIEGVRDVRV